MKLGFWSGIGKSLSIGFSGVSDTTAPTVAITSTETSPSTAATIPLTITFSEAVTGFVVGDITAAGCTLSNVATSDNIIFTVTATPTAYEVTIDIAAGVCADAAGNTNTAATQFAISALVKWYLAGAIPAANVVAAYKPVGAADLAASYLRVAGSGGNANLDPAVVGVGVAPTFAAATGWAFNGSTQFLDSGINTAAKTWSRLVQFSNAAEQTNKQIIGRNDASADVYLHVGRPGTSVPYYGIGANTTNSLGAAMVAGNLCMAGLKGYRDGVFDVDLLDSWSGSGTRNLYFGCTNNAGTAGSFQACSMQAYVEYNITLTPAQVAAVAAAMATLANP